LPGQLETPTAEQLNNHEVQDTIDRTQALFWQLSGHGRFRNAKHIAELYEIIEKGDEEEKRDAQAKLDSLKTEITAQVLTDDGIAERVKQFQAKVHLKKPLLACASCGCRSFELEYHPANIDQLAIFRLNEAQIERYKSLGVYRAILSVYTDTDGTLYNLHPELVAPATPSSPASAWLCTECHTAVKANKVPLFSVAAGLDFGRLSRLRLLGPEYEIPPLSLVEIFLLAPVRMYGCVVKATPGPASSLALHGHVISFPHDGPEVCAKAVSLPNIEAAGWISVAFVGPKKKWETVKNELLEGEQLRVRPEVLFKMLKLKKALDPLHYAHIPIDESPEMVAYLEALPQQIIDNGTVLGDERTAHLDKLATDDVAGVRDLHPERQENDGTTIFSDILLTKETELAAREVAGKILGAAAKSLGGKITASRTSETPLNEFEENNELFLGQFPHLFLLGVTFPTRGTLSQREISHLIYQHTGKFAREPRLIFTLFNQRQRHKTASSVSGFAQCDPTKIEKLGVLTKDPEFRKQLDLAVKDPESKEAKEILKTLTPLVGVMGSKVDFSPVARAAAQTTLKAYTQYFGPPSMFLTIAPDDTHSVLGIRLSFPSAETNANNAFPAVESGLIEKLLEGAKSFEVGKVDISEFALQKLVAANPVAAAEVYKITMEAVFSCLVGLEPERLVRRSNPVGNNPGLFGDCRGWYSVIETQGRLSLHTHAIIWAGLNSAIFQKGAPYEYLVELIRQVLESHCQAHLPPVFHFRAMTRLATHPEERPPLKPNRMAYVTPEPPATPQAKVEFEEHGNSVVDRTAVHSHGSTCEKTNAGKGRCRLDFPRDEKEKTDPVQLKLTEAIKKGKKAKFSVNKEIDHEVRRPRNYVNHPISYVDPRCIVWELKRPFVLTTPKDNPHISCEYPQHQDEIKGLLNLIEALPDNMRGLVLGMIETRNQAVVETSPALAACLGCNVAAYSLGGGEQSQGATMYLLDYVTKDQTSLAASLSLFQAALKKMDKYPSRAEDQGTDSRTGKYFMNITLNAFTGASEVAITQAAASLIGLPAQEGSAKTVFVPMANAIATVTARVLKATGRDPSVAWRAETRDHGLPFPPQQQNAEREDDDDLDIGDWLWERDANGNVDDEDEEVKLADWDLDTDEGEAGGGLNFGDQLGNDYSEIEGEGKRGGWSGVQLYKVVNPDTGEEVIVPVPKETHYAHRGEHLHQLCFVEYLSTIEVIKKEIEREGDSGEVPQKSAARGRKGSTTFPFAQTHPLYATHHQRIRSKLLLPVFLGIRPPTFRQLDSPDFDYAKASQAVKKELLRGAVWLLVSFSKWTPQAEVGEPKAGELVPAYPLTWEGFCDFAKLLETSGKFVDSAMYDYICSITRGLRVSSINRVMAREYRSRCATQWGGTKVNPCNVVPYFGNIWKSAGQGDGSGPGKEAESKEELREELLKEIELLRSEARGDDATAKVTPEQKMARYLANTKKELEAVLPKEATSFPGTVVNGGSVASSSAFFEGAERACDTAWQTLLEKRRKQEEEDVRKETVAVSVNQGTDSEDGKGVSNTIDHIIDNQLQSLLSGCKPTEDQTTILRAVTTWAVSMASPLASRPPPLLLLIHGGPGVGKTWTILKATEVLSKNGLRSASAAFTGSAATLMPGAETIHALLGLATVEKKSKDKKQDGLNPVALQTLITKFEKIDVLVFDEISMVSSELLGEISERLSLLCSNKAPFGGKSVLLLGDFMQLPPVGGHSLYADLIDFSTEKAGATKATIASSPRRLLGVTMFAQFQRLELTQQVRAAEDAVQMGFLTKLRDLSQTHPVTDDLIRSLSTRVLTEFDLHDITNTWSEASICVTTNAERLNLTPVCALQFARRHNVPSIVWKLEAAGPIFDRLIELGQNSESLFTLESGLIGMFVQGAPGYLTENIDPLLGLANGTAVIFHSLSFEGKTIIEKEEVRVLLANAKGGEIVHLPFAPTFVNVAVKLTEKQKEMWVEGTTLIEGQTVIPIGLCSRKSKVEVEQKTPTLVLMGTVNVREHRMELGFVQTFHKIQGRTVSRLILELNPRPFQPRVSFSMLLVALSRVRHHMDIRILRMHPGANLSYLLRLRPDPKLALWQAGYKGGTWAPDTKQQQQQQQQQKQPKSKAAQPRGQKRAAPAKQSPAPPPKKRAPANNLPIPIPIPIVPSLIKERGFPHRANSCHIDSLLEGCYSALQSGPLPPWIIPPITIESAHQKLATAETASEMLAVGLQVRHHSNLFDSPSISWLRDSLRELLHQKFGSFDQRGNGNQMCDIMEWLPCFNGDPAQNGLLNTNFETKLTCQCGSSTLWHTRQLFTKPGHFPSLRQGLLESLEYDGHAHRCGSCSALKTQTLSRAAFAPVVMCAVDCPVELGQIVSIADSNLRVMAISRFVNRNHFVVFSRRGEQYFMYDDMQNHGLLQQVRPILERHMPGDRNALFLGHAE